MDLAVLLKGMLHGPGGACACEVLATRHASSDGRETYSDLRLLAPPGEWADGEYTLDMDVLSTHVEHRAGRWRIQPEPGEKHICFGEGTETTEPQKKGEARAK